MLVELKIVDDDCVMLVHSFSLLLECPFCLANIASLVCYTLLTDLLYCFRVRWDLSTTL